jgi:hypothetical protein
MSLSLFLFLCGEQCYLYQSSDECNQQPSCLFIHSCREKSVLRCDELNLDSILCEENGIDGLTCIYLGDAWCSDFSDEIACTKIQGVINCLTTSRLECYYAIVNVILSNYYLLFFIISFNIVLLSINIIHSTVIINELL